MCCLCCYPCCYLCFVILVVIYLLLSLLLFMLLSLLFTLLAVGASDLDGRQVVEQLLEVWVADARPPGVVSAVMEPETHPMRTG